MLTATKMIHTILNRPGDYTFVRCGLCPSFISANEIEGIKKILSLDQNISIETKFYKGERVRITYGLLTGQEGMLIKQKGKMRFGIQLKEINHTVLIDICTSALEKITNKNFLNT